MSATQVAVEGAELEVSDVGTGAPVLFIHGSAIRDSLLPLTKESAFETGHRVISYHRRGFGRKPIGPTTIATQAADAAAVLKSLGVEKAHVVGHSYGAVIAIQLAHDSPDLVSSLVLMEPGLFANVKSGPATLEGLELVFESFGKGDKQAALTGFLTAVAGPEHKAAIDATMPPGSYQMALDDIDTLFKVEFPAVLAWTFGADKGYEKLTLPILALSGTKSMAAFVESSDLLKTWMPQVQRQNLEGADHMFPLSKSAETAEHITKFIASVNR